MKKTIAILAICSLALGQQALAAAACEALSDADSDLLVALQATAGADELLQIDFDEGQICRLSRGSADLEEQASSSLHVSASLDELAVRARVEGFDTWLRIDSRYDETLVLDRATSEALHLTDGEFLGDNSLLEASDFFVEFVASLEFGSYELNDVEAEIPHLDASYDHYAGRGTKPAATDPDAEFLTTGSIGAELLEDMIITLDFANERIYIRSSR